MIIGQLLENILKMNIDKKYKGEKFEVVLYQGESTKSESFLAKTTTVKLNPVQYIDVKRVRNAKIIQEV